MLATTQRNGSTRKWRQTLARMLRAELPCICQLCGQWVTDERHADIDHVVPASLGGTDHRTNLRVVHATCNRSRGNGSRGRRVVEPIPRTPDPFAAPERTWSRHWSTPGVYEPRCARCRQLGSACTDADPDLAA